MKIEFLHSKFQSFSKKDGFFDDYDKGFENSALFETDKLRGKAQFVVSYLKHIANPNWTFSNANAEKALKNYLDSFGDITITKELNLEFLLESDEFFVLE